MDYLKFTTREPLHDYQTGPAICDLDDAADLHYTLPYLLPEGWHYRALAAVIDDDHYGPFTTRGEAEEDRRERAIPFDDDDSAEALAENAWEAEYER